MLDKEKNQFFKELKQGTELFRARIIKVEDDNNPDSGVGKTKTGLFTGYMVLMHKQANHSFWDFNNKQAIFSNPENNLMDYDSKIAEEHVIHLSQTFRRTDL